MPSIETDLLLARERLAELLSRARRILVFTGAGISTASGIPDFRGPGGVWSRRRPIYYDEFMASDEARVAHWEYKLEGWDAFRAASPNAVHESIVALERAGCLEHVVTQNIDGLHSLAGTSPERLVELHGTNAEVECQTCLRRCSPEAAFESFRRTQECPRCTCGGFLKPATISFGQALREKDLERAFRTATAADLAVALGSTLSVHPAAAVPLCVVERGQPYAIVNRGATDHDDLDGVTLRVEGDVLEVFPSAVAAALA